MLVKAIVVLLIALLGVITVGLGTIVLGADLVATTQRITALTDGIARIGGVVLLLVAAISAIRESRQSA